MPRSRREVGGSEAPFRRLLVPLDMGVRGDRALAVALPLARQSRGRVVLVHVIQRVADTPVSELKGFYRRLVAKAQRKLARAAQAFVRAGVPVRVEVRIGDPPREIVAIAATTRADLIIMGSHRVRPGRRADAGWGTTSYKVGILCPGHILLVK